MGDCIRHLTSAALRDGMSFNVKACNTGVGEISLGGGRIQRDYMAGSPPGGDEIAYFQISDSDRIPSVWNPGSFVADATSVWVKALDWRSGKLLLNIDHSPAFSLNDYIAYVHGDGDRLLRRLDFSEATRFDRQDAAEHVRITFSNYVYVYQWDQCEKPMEDFTGISFVEKAYAGVTDDTPRC